MLRSLSHSIRVRWPQIRPQTTTKEHKYDMIKKIKNTITKLDLKQQQHKSIKMTLNGSTQTNVQQKVKQKKSVIICIF